MPSTTVRSISPPWSTSVAVADDDGTGSDARDALGVSELAPPEDRGSLNIAEKIVEKVATMAASEVDQVTDHRMGWRRIPGQGLPKATAEIAGGHARIGVQIATPWPSPLTDIATQTRDHVRERVASLTGLDVVAVDVTVADVVHVATGKLRVQ